MGERKQIAVVLAGAVAKGAFEAGALAELVKQEVDIRSIVAASSGALNGTVLASAVHGAKSRADLIAEVEDLCTLWVERGGAGDAFNTSIGDVVARRGLSDQENLRKLLSDNVKVRTTAPSRPGVVLTIVVSPLAGVAADHGSSFEHSRRFSNVDFETPEHLGNVFEAAVASSSFPGAFVPTTVANVGPCVDGGTVNNTPLKYALSGGPIDTVVLIAPTPAKATITHEAADKLHGLGLMGRLSDMLINERLHRDLREARETNDALRKLESDDRLREHVVAIKECLGWSGRRPISICCIRPEHDLKGNAFSGFFCQKLREEYVAAGRERAGDLIAKGLPDTM